MLANVKPFTGHAWMYAAIMKNHMPFNFLATSIYESFSFSIVIPETSIIASTKEARSFSVSVGMLLQNIGEVTTLA